MPTVPHLLSVADLSTHQLQRIIHHAHMLKKIVKPSLMPMTRASATGKDKPRRVTKSLQDKSIALLFSKRSTRTRVSAETSAHILGGQALFLGKEDIQLGVNESVRDSARVLSSLCQGIFARVGAHSEIEELAKYSQVPVLNALSDLWHPTQILADLLTVYERPWLFDPNHGPAQKNLMGSIRPLTVTYVGDCNNILHDMLVAYPRLGHNLRVASPEKYRAPPAVWDKVEKLGCQEKIFWTADPKEAVKDADIVVTDTWISMGQEAETEQRLKDFAGYQVTEQLCKEGGAKENWRFLHCLPRHKEEVDDEVFYGTRSLAWAAAENRKWTIMAVFDVLFGRGHLFPYQPAEPTQGKPDTPRAKPQRSSENSLDERVGKTDKKDLSAGPDAKLDKRTVGTHDEPAS